jgi:kynurenine formamidase
MDPTVSLDTPSQPRWEYELIDLTRPVTPETQYALMGDLADEDHNPVINYVHEWSTSNGCVCHFSVIDHPATHIDAPYHTVESGARLEGVDISRLFGEAVVLDLYKGDVDYGYTAADLEAANPKIEEGDIVLIHSGYHDAGQGKRIRQTYLTVGAAEWLVTKGVHAVGCEPAGIEHLPEAYLTKRWYDKDTPEPTPWPAHRVLLGNDVYIIEGLTNLERIKGQRVHFAALPLLIPGLSGSPVRAVAWLDKSA